MDGIEGRGPESIGLLDLLILIAQELRRLIGVPIAIGVVAYAATFLIPHEHVSHSILALPVNSSTASGSTPTGTYTQTPTQAAALMVSAVVLDPVIELLRLADDRPIPVARLSLAEDVEAGVGVDGFLRLSVTRSDPAESIAISNAIIDEWLKTTIPMEAERKELAERLAFSKESLLTIGQLLKTLAGKDGVNLRRSATMGETGPTIVAVGQLQAHYLNEVFLLPKLMAGMSRDVVKQVPTLVADTFKPKRGLIAVSAALSVGIILLAWIFVRQAWRLASKDPESALKQKQLVVALRSQMAGQ